MKFQVFLIAVVVMMTGGAIMVAQSVPTGYRAGGAPSSRIQIPPAADTSTAAGEARPSAPQAGAGAGLSPATAIALPSGIESPATSVVSRTDGNAASVTAACVSGRRSGHQGSLEVHLTAPAGVAADVRGHGAKARCAAATVSGGQVSHADDDEQNAEAGD